MKRRRRRRGKLLLRGASSAGVCWRLLPSMVAGNILAPSQAGLMVGHAREKDGDTSQPSKAASNTPPRASHPPAASPRG